MLCKLNRQILSAAKRKGAFKKKIIAAINLTFIPCNRKKISQRVVGDKPKKATSFFHYYATIRIASSERRFTIKTRQTHQRSYSDLFLGWKGAGLSF